MKTALLLIATGERYWKFADALIENARDYLFPHDVVLFTEAPQLWEGRSDVHHVVPYGHLGYPEATYRRYHGFMSAADIIFEYDQVFYSDVDSEFVNPVYEEDIFSNGITATEHPGFVGQRGDHEKNPRSTAYCPNGNQYFCGGFNGGNAIAFLEMSRTIAERINLDDKNGVQPHWVDESQYNNYLYDHPPAKILSPSFCYPEDTERYLEIWKKAGREPFVPKLVALDKGKR
jgi:hypothetical protein